MRAGALLVCAMLMACSRDAEVGTASGAAAGIPAPESRLEALRLDADHGGFTVADRPITFAFPRDHGPHPGFRHEWWYLTGHLDAQNGDHYGFQLTFFRFALAPPGTVAAAASAWRTREIFMAHFAITDVARGEFHFDQRLSRKALGLAGAQVDPLRVWLEDWSLQMRGASGPWALRAAAKDHELNLELRPLLPPVLNGDRGLSRKSGHAGAASYYYSIPRMTAHGRMSRAGVAHEVEGMAWLDREWGSGALAPDQAGWDWFALQFDDGGTLMFYALRRRDGTRDPLSAGTWVAPDGVVRTLANTDLELETLDHWESPQGTRYPARWRLRIPTLDLDISVRPLLADQELRTDPRYWEGAVEISGARRGEKAAGQGYVELVGYAGDRRR